MSAARTLVHLALALLLGACANQQDLSVPAPSKAEQYPLGCEVRLTARRMVVRGELIGVHDGRYVLLQGNELLAVDTALAFKEAMVVLSRTSERPNGYAWTSFLPLVSISHGYFGVFTLPLNIITAVSVQTGAAKSRYVIYLDPVRSNVLGMYARFPQGIPTSFLEHRKWID